MAYLYEMEEVTKHYGKNTALANLTLKIEDNITAIIGYSGAGKTTLLKMLAGLEIPSSGTIQYKGTVYLFDCLMDDMKINTNEIREKFGDDYMADERTFIMGIDQRFTKHFAERFVGFNVLETCTGAGFTTLSLARTAKHVFTVEIDEANREKAIGNIEKAGLSTKVTFLMVA